MNRLTEKLTRKLLPTATGKAAPARGACWSGCGDWGIWRDRNAKPGDKAPCC